MSDDDDDIEFGYITPGDSITNQLEEMRSKLHDDFVAARETHEAAMGRLTAPFEGDELSHRSEVWCERCLHVNGSCHHHPAGVCAECGQWMSPAHRHIPYVSNLALRSRILSVDPNWSWRPMAIDERGYPMFQRHGSYDVLWIELTILGITHLGIGQSYHDENIYGVVGLMNLAINNAALSFGMGLDLRQVIDRQSRPIQTLADAKLVTQDDLKTEEDVVTENAAVLAGGIARALEAVQPFKLEFLKEYARTFAPEIPKGRTSKGSLMISLTRHFGVEIPVMVQALHNNVSPITEEEE